MIYYFFIINKQVKIPTRRAVVVRRVRRFESVPEKRLRLVLNALINTLENYSNPSNGEKIKTSLINSIRRKFLDFIYYDFSNYTVKRFLNKLDLSSDLDGQITIFIWNSLISALKSQNYPHSHSLSPLSNGFFSLITLFELNILLPERRALIYRQLFDIFKSDPEINANYKVDFKIEKDRQLLIDTGSTAQLLDVVNTYGSFEDLIFLLKRPDFKLQLNGVIKFHKKLLTPQINELVQIFKNNLMIQRHQLPEEFHDWFGFLPPDSDNDNSLEKIKVDFHFREPVISRRNLGPRCHGCQEITKRSELRFKGPGSGPRPIPGSDSDSGVEPIPEPDSDSGSGECKCQFHAECALNLVVSYAKHILDPNKMERFIMVCPGCQSEIRPSFVLAVIKYLGQLDHLLDIIDKLPTDFMKNYRNDLKYLSLIDIKKLDETIFVLKHQTNPKFAPCPVDGCVGFALVDPDQEIRAECLICQKTNLFIGKQRQIEIQKENPEILQLLKSNKQTIRPCTHCGKLIEKLDGCNSMHCIFCNTFFDWVAALNVSQQRLIHY